jgi:hypothetical protein
MKRHLAWIAGGVVAAAAVAAAVAASTNDGPTLTNVPAANTKSTGYSPPSVLSPVVVAQGATRVENPSSDVSYYGYDNDLLNEQGQPVMVPGGTFTSEASKTGPDKNTYLVFDRGLRGADPSYDYGTHFLFQGHETGAPGYVTRINLDADAAHRVTVLATKDATGAPIADIDGSTWDPWAKRLLLTTESAGAPTYSATPDYPSTVTDVSGTLGRGGYEGIQDDSAGNVWIVEDAGGGAKLDAAGHATTAKRPNSFIFRYVPARPGDLAHGKLEALQVLNAAGAPVTFESQAALNAPDQIALRTYGASFRTKWVVVHDTAVDGTASFNANTAAKAAHATPFKRPENGQFRPDSRFREFFFDETGDTDATSRNATAGGWGSIFQLTQKSPDADTGTLTLFFRCDGGTSALDNVTFVSREEVTFVQDMGDTAQTQLNALDSGYVWNVTTDYSNPANRPVRWLAEGRDPSATIDSANGGFAKNEGDNEITGVHVSDGDPGPAGILGARAPRLFDRGWRWFYTQQNGDNPTYEVLPAGGRTTGPAGDD